MPAQRSRRGRAGSFRGPRLTKEERLSSYVDYALLLPNYADLEAAEGEERARDILDYLFHYLGLSIELLDEPEFADLQWPLNPHDYLVYELYHHILSQGWDRLDGLTSELRDERVEHMVHDGLRRLLVGDLRREIRSRAQRLSARVGAGVLQLEAQAVATALGELDIDPMAISALVESLRRALVDAAADLPERIEREWEERDRSLDGWLEAIRRPGSSTVRQEAIRRLQEAGRAALPLVAHMYHDLDYTCHDEPLQAALQVAAAIPDPQSLWFLSEAMRDCAGLAGWAASQMAANMPAEAAAYWRFLLTEPAPTDPCVAANALIAASAARLPEAYDLALLGLEYKAADPSATEAVQVAAWRALLDLDNPDAGQRLRDYVESDEASPTARDQLVQALVSEPQEGWRADILRRLPVLP
ncbi:MAG: hypothetical protein ACUVX9_17805 [Anaerolineae bacterium]